MQIQIQSLRNIRGIIMHQIKPGDFLEKKCWNPNPFETGFNKINNSRILVFYCIRQKSDSQDQMSTRPDGSGYNMD